MYGGHLEIAVRDGLDLRQEVAQKIAQEMLSANRSAVNTKGFELEAERMARLMRDKYRVGFVDIGGWDTHVAREHRRARSPQTRESWRGYSCCSDNRHRVEHTVSSCSPIRAHFP